MAASSSMEFQGMEMASPMKKQVALLKQRGKIANNLLTRMEGNTCSYF